MSLKWYVAVTTAPRQECTLETTCNSLVRCGWQPYIFAEPGSTLVEHTTYWNSERLGLWYNWLQSVRIALDSDADTIMTVQDDTLFHPDSKLLIESIEWPKNTGYISLYTPRHYQYEYGLKRPNGLFNISVRSVWGSVALIFKRDVLEKLINTHTARTWTGLLPRTPSISERKIEPCDIKQNDYVIGKILQENLKLKLYYFNPSPCSHISNYSSVGHGPNTGKRNAKFIADPTLPLIPQIYDTDKLPIS